MIVTSNGRWVIKKTAILPGIIKLLLFLMVVYEGWYLQKYAVIPGLLQILALLIVGTTGILLIKKPWCGQSKLVKYWIIFGIYSLLAALAANANMAVVLDSLFTYFSFVAMVYCAGVVSKYTSNYSWFSKAVFFTCIVNAVSALFFGVAYKNGEYFVTTMSEINNPNTLGLMMGIGTFLAVFPEKRLFPLEWAMRIALMFAFLLVTINTGSRSAVVCEIVVVILFVYSRLKNVHGKAVDRFAKKLVLGTVAIAAAIVVFNLIRINNADGSAIRRLLEKFNEEAFLGRTDLYKAAWDLYKESPIFGIGYNCFGIASGYGYFSHSTYMELLACTGTIGFLLFLMPVFAGAWRGIRNFKVDGGRATAILVMMLVSGFFGIVYYGMVFLMVLYIELCRMPSKTKRT